MPGSAMAVPLGTNDSSMSNMLLASTNPTAIDIVYLITNPLFLPLHLK